MARHKSLASLAKDLWPFYEIFLKKNRNHFHYSSRMRQGKKNARHGKHFNGLRPRKWHYWSFQSGRISHMGSLTSPCCRPFFVLWAVIVWSAWPWPCLQAAPEWARGFSLAGRRCVADSIPGRFPCRCHRCASIIGSFNPIIHRGLPSTGFASRWMAHK